MLDRRQTVLRCLAQEHRHRDLLGPTHAVIRSRRKIKRCRFCIGFAFGFGAALKWPTLSIGGHFITALTMSALMIGIHRQTDSRHVSIVNVPGRSDGAKRETLASDRLDERTGTLRIKNGGTMQFYLNGYAPGDPDIAKEKLPDAVDVLAIGSGPAGTLLAAQLSNFPRISTRLIARRSGALRVGRTDGRYCLPDGGNVRSFRPGSKAHT